MRVPLKSHATRFFLISSIGLLSWSAIGIIWIYRLSSRPLFFIALALGIISFLFVIIDSYRNKLKAHRRLDRVRQVKAEQSAILRTMVEGIVTFDSAGLIRRINPAAYHLLDLPKTMSEGETLIDGVTDENLRKGLSDLLRNQGPNPRLVSIDSIEPRHLELHFSPLLVDGRTKPGSLLVIHDVTKIQKLERIRRDFVANVSHELRTPITSIKGFVETLLDGAKEEKPLLDKFLGTIDRQAERLNSIFEDLLTLSRLEAGVGDTPLDKELKAIEEIVDAAMEECLPLAEAKRINISVSKDLSGIVEVNARFLEQALVNLIENAIKYSREDAVIRVGRVAHVSHVGIAVVDKGLGIPEKHLPRLFERFYRVDPGRSRQMGGTGLGLAIVKHIAQLHGGWISVESREGLGSTFTLFVPRADVPR